MCTLMSQHLSNVRTHLHIVLTTPDENACILRKKCKCTRTCGYATVQKILCHGCYCELILSRVRALLRLSFAARSAACPAVSTKPVARRCLLQNSVQIHASSRRSRRCGVAQASLNHPRWWMRPALFTRTTKI